MKGKKREDIVRLVSEIFNILSEKEKKQILRKISNTKELPLSIFKTKNLSGLESIVIYLKDINNKTIKEISDTLNRKNSTIYTTYNNAKKKLKGELDCSDNSISIPISIFSNRKFAVLESLVFYLKHGKKLSLMKIASLLKRSYSTIKTAYWRYGQKTNGKK